MKKTRSIQITDCANDYSWYELFRTGDMVYAKIERINYSPCRIKITWEYETRNATPEEIKRSEESAQERFERQHQNRGFRSDD